jgi:hypothetical protein
LLKPENDSLLAAAALDLYRNDRSGPFIISFYALLYDGFKNDLVAENDCIWLFP